MPNELNKEEKNPWFPLASIQPAETTIIVIKFENGQPFCVIAFINYGYGLIAYRFEETKRQRRKKTEEKSLGLSTPIAAFHAANKTASHIWNGKYFSNFIYGIYLS